jgi:hypothetical protein
MQIGKPRAVSVSDIVMRSPASAFDGHTEFARLSTSQRLHWISEVALFWWNANKNNRSLDTVRELRQMCKDVRLAQRHI